MRPRYLMLLLDELEAILTMMMMTLGYMIYLKKSKFTIYANPKYTINLLYSKQHGLLWLCRGGER